MTNRPVIDTLEFAKKEQTQDLELRSVDLARLTDESTIVNDIVTANITGGTQTDGKPFIDLKILSGLRLTCQRCLGLFDLQINSNSRFIIALRENELSEVSLEEQHVNTVLDCQWFRSMVKVSARVLGYWVSKQIQRTHSRG